MIITSLWTIDLLILFTTIAFLAYKYLTRNYDYFKNRNIYYEKPIPPIGSIWPVISLKMTVGEWLRDMYNSFNAPCFGIFVFDDPYLIIKSPELIKQILIKDFSVFSDRAILCSKHDTVMGNMMFSQRYPDWKNLRSKMNPVFSSVKLKGMFSTVNEVGVELSRYIKQNLGELESRELSAKFTTDVIAKCAFAMEARSFQDENTEFRQVSRVFFDPTLRNSIAQTFYMFKQNWARILRLPFFDTWGTTFLKGIFWDAIRYREQNNIKGKDFIDILVEMRRNKELSDEFGGDIILAQAVQFFIAGFETTSTTLSFTLYELCLQPKIQNKLREEITNNIKKYNGVTYDCLQEMKYMEMCILETLRKYPVLPFLDRKCKEDYSVDGTDLIIEKGMSVYIPMMALHHDEKYFPEPEKYDPERFADKNSYNVNGLYYLPFGGGPRICIGERFGMLELKVGLTHILSEYILEKTPETPVPIKFAQKCILLQSKDGLPIRFKQCQPAYQ